MRGRQRGIGDVMTTEHITDMNDHGIQAVHAPALFLVRMLALALPVLIKSIIFSAWGKERPDVKKFWEGYILVQLLDTTSVGERNAVRLGRLLEPLQMNNQDGWCVRD